MVLAQACTPETVPWERVTVGGLNDRVALDTADRSRAGGRTERGGAVGAAQLVDRGGCAPSVVVVVVVLVLGALRAAGHPDREVVVLGAKRVVAIAHLGPRGLACVAHTEPIRAGELGGALEAVPRRVAIQVVAAVVALGQAA